jgi:hypothetical protein
LKKNNYDLYNKDDRNELFHEYLVKLLPDLDFNEFEDCIAFLCNIGLSEDWLNVVAITIGEQVCPNTLKSETSVVHSVGIKELLTLAKELMVFDKNKIAHYVSKLNVRSFARISVLSEIKIASSYQKNGYQIKVEPPNGRIGKSGLEGKSDLGVNFNGQWIYFEITQENSEAPKDSNLMVADISYFIREEIRKGNIISSKMKIYAMIIDKNRVLSRGWKNRLLNHLKSTSFKLNNWKQFEGILYRVSYRLPDEGVFLMGIPVTSSRKYFVKRIKEEEDQIPNNVEGVIAFGLSSPLNIQIFRNYAQQVLTRNTFGSVTAIVIWYQKDYWIICKESVNQHMVDFISIPFRS